MSVSSRASSKVKSFVEGQVSSQVSSSGSSYRSSHVKSKVKDSEAPSQNHAVRVKLPKNRPTEIFEKGGILARILRLFQKCYT